MNCDEFGDGLENDCVINREKDPVNSKVFGVNRRSNFSRKVRITNTLCKIMLSTNFIVFSPRRKVMMPD